MSDPDYDDDAQPYNDRQMIIDTIRVDSTEAAWVAARKFYVSTPALERVKATKKKCPRDENSSSNSPATSSRPRKKAKTKAAPIEIDDDDDDDDDPPYTIAVYAWISKNPAPTTPKSRKINPNPGDVVKKGPFNVSSKDNYPIFLSKLAAALPCRPDNIHEQKILWKPVKPMNVPSLPLGGANGYKIMISAFTDRKSAERMVVPSMPAPGQPMEEETICPDPWPIGADDDKKPPIFDYTELEPTGPSDSIHQQQISFNKATKTERALLEDTYPIGNYPAIDPNKRIYHDPKTNFYFDLNSSRTGVWSSATAQNKTDEMKPPLESRFFDAKQRMEIGNTPPADFALPGPAITAVAGPAVTAPPPAAPLSLSNLLMASILSQSGAGVLTALLPQLNPARAPAPLAPTPANDPAQHRTAPPSPVKWHTVTVERFCEFYDIDAIDCTRLQEVGFRPGDPTQCLQSTMPWSLGPLRLINP
ncbi:hypothetical protein B0H13DRAFT_2300762 [Mycena leptocephala]|nr:hypothetical protein B0H13DRAFT_2300762 [Mycena leptocephala]